MYRQLYCRFTYIQYVPTVVLPFHIYTVCTDSCTAVSHICSMYRQLYRRFTYIQYVPTIVLPFHKCHPTVLSHFPSTVTLPVHTSLGRTEHFCNYQLLNDHRLYTAVIPHTKSYICSIDMYCIFVLF